MARSKKTQGIPLGMIALILITTATAVALAIRPGNGVAIPWPQLVPYAIFLASLPVAWVWLKLSKFQGDATIPVIALLLSGLGIVLQFRMGAYATATLWSNAWIAYPLGFAAFLVAITLFNKKRLALLASSGWLCYILALLVLGAMVVLGRRYRGGIYMPGNINPSELIKPLLVIFLAAFLARRQKAFSETMAGLPTPRLAEVFMLLLAWMVPVAVILYLKDLGLLILLNAVLVTMLYAATRRNGYLVVGVIGVVGLAFLAMAISAHARTRLEIWQNPFADPTGKGWQALQGLAAMYSGGMWGAGIGAGVPQTVPIVSSDFVYAAWAEEAGFAGCVLLLAIFATLFARGWRAGANAATPFASLLGSGLTAALAIQTILNVAGVTKALPLTGIPLPFISHGGSSLVATLVMAGLLAAVSDK